MENEVQTRKKVVIHLLRKPVQFCYWACVAAAGILALYGILLFIRPSFFDWDHAYGLFGRWRLEINGLLLYSFVGKYSIPATDHLPVLERGYYFFYAISAFAIALFFHKFDNLLASVEKGSPFTPENARRLTVMGLILIGVFGISQALYFMRALWYSDYMNIDIKIDVGSLLFGIVLLILARVFKYGSYLQDEYDATV